MMRHRGRWRNGGCGRLTAATKCAPTPTGPGRGYEELQDEMDRLEQSVGGSGWTRWATPTSLLDD